MNLINDMGLPYMRNMYAVWDAEASKIAKKEEDVHDTSADQRRLQKKHR